MPVLVAALPVLLAVHGASPGSGSTAGTCSSNPAIICTQVQGGAGGAGGSSTQGIICNHCIIMGPKAGDGGEGGSAQVQGVRPPASSDNSQPNPSVRIARCTLTIAGESVVDASPCVMRQATGLVSLYARSVNQKYNYITTVQIGQGGAGHGLLAGGNSSTTRDLGTLSKSGACWVNDSVSICAWK